jgi:hypothetical protein
MKMQNANVWYNLAIIIPKNIRLIPFNTTYQNNSNEPCFIFLWLLDKEIAIFFFFSAEYVEIY